MDVAESRQLHTLTAEEIDHVDLGLIHSTDCRFRVEQSCYVITGPLGEKVHCSPRLTVAEVWESAQALQLVFENEQEIEA